jgi:hypothetical protein
MSRCPSCSLWLVAVVFVTTLVGCGGRAKDAPKLYRVSGSVTYKGQPVPGAKVMFLGDGKSPPAVGVTDDSGKFALSSLAGSGAVAGKHPVMIVKNTDAAPDAPADTSMEGAAKAAQAKNSAPKEASLIPSKYANAATSGLEFEVKASGSNDFTIDLKD